MNDAQDVKEFCFDNQAGNPIVYDKRHFNDIKLVELNCGDRLERFIIAKNLNGNKIMEVRAGYCNYIKFEE